MLDDFFRRMLSVDHYKNWMRVDGLVRPLARFKNSWRSSRLGSKFLYSVDIIECHTHDFGHNRV